MKDLDRVERDRGRAEVMQSSAFGHVLATEGLLALLLFPLTWVLARVTLRFRRRAQPTGELGTFDPSRTTLDGGE